MAALSGIVLFFFILVVLGIYTFVSASENRIWQERQAEAVRSASTTINTFINARQNEIFLIGSLGGLTAGEDAEAFTTFLREPPYWLEIILVDRNNQVLYSGYTDQPLLNEMLNSPLPDWLTAAQQGQVYASNVAVGAENTTYLVIAVPVKDGRVAAARLQMDLLWNIVNGIRFGQTGLVYIINRSTETLVVHPDMILTEQKTDISANPIYRDIFAGKTMPWRSVYHNPQEQPVHVMAAPITGTEWVLVSEIGRSEVIRLRRLAVIAFAAGLLLLWLAITGFSRLFLERWVFKPLTNLRKGASMIGHGNLKYRIPVLRPDEFGQVTEDFNIMTERLDEQQFMLIRARDQAISNSQFKSQLLANVSHELRTPLGVILGFAEMLSEGVLEPVTEKQRDPLNNIIQSATSLNQMVNNLLDQARLEAGAVRLNITDFSPRKLMNQIHLQVNILAERKGLRLTSEVDPAVPDTLRGDITRIQQILLNLAGNAIKFTTQGQVDLRLLMPDSEHWAIQVADTGPGIPPESQQIIFEPFRQLDGSPTRPHGGTGLGLSIVQQLTQYMGGEIKLQSEVGQGSTFTVIFPVEVVTRRRSKKNE
jgi:signal transduction histidine kinase